MRHESCKDTGSPILELQLSLSEGDLRLWDIMDRATFDTIRGIGNGDECIQYWSNSQEEWTSILPSIGERRSSVLVHEGCMTPAGDADDSLVSANDFSIRGHRDVVRLVKYHLWASILTFAVHDWLKYVVLCWELESNNDSLCVRSRIREKVVSSRSKESSLSCRSAKIVSSNSSCRNYRPVMH